jgi:hypothetical protein
VAGRGKSFPRNPVPVQTSHTASEVSVLPRVLERREEGHLSFQ